MSLYTGREWNEAAKVPSCNSVSQPVQLIFYGISDNGKAEIYWKFNWTGDWFKQNLNL